MWLGKLDNDPKFEEYRKKIRKHFRIETDGIQYRIRIRGVVFWAHNTNFRGDIITYGTKDEAETAILRMIENAYRTKTGWRKC
jgi:hypothetical protein